MSLHIHLEPKKVTSILPDSLLENEFPLKRKGTLDEREKAKLLAQK